MKPGHRWLSFDPQRIKRATNVTVMLHSSVRPYPRAYEVRFDDHDPYPSLVVVGPEGLLNHLQDVMERRKISGIGHATQH